MVRSLLCLLIMISGPSLLAQQSLPVASNPQSVGAQMKASAAKLLSSMDAKTKKKALYPFESKERSGWRYLPSPSRLTSVIFPDHSGIRYIDLTDAQKQFVRALLASGLSALGLNAVDAAYHLDQDDTLKFRGLLDWLLFSYGQENYYVSLFGSPEDDHWAWRFEGHHISLNFTLDRQGVVSTTPTFIGTTLASVVVDGRNIQVLSAVKTSAYSLVSSLDPNQYAQAGQSMQKVPMFTKFTPGLFSKELKIKKPLPSGLSFRDMNRRQQEIVLQVLSNYQAQFSSELTEQTMDKINSEGTDSIEFIWTGDRSMNQPFYFRIQGAHFALEFTCSEGKADHYHTAWIEF